MVLYEVTYCDFYRKSVFTIKNYYISIFLKGSTALQKSQQKEETNFSSWSKFIHAFYFAFGYILKDFKSPLFRIGFMHTFQDTFISWIQLIYSIIVHLLLWQCYLTCFNFKRNMKTLYFIHMIWILTPKCLCNITWKLMFR